jgi:hypothetical protein
MEIWASLTPGPMFCPLHIYFHQPSLYPGRGLCKQLGLSIGANAMSPFELPGQPLAWGLTGLE